MPATGTIRKRLLRWYHRNRRDLPWRRDSDPYRIFLSEMMLQQTRVAAVIPYYQRFLERFPDVDALARAPEQEVLAAWSGLGYYARARNLQKAARQIAAAGRFPTTYEGIRALPGVGDYTAAAIASIAFHLPHPVLDGNVRRLLARLSAEDGDMDAASTRRRLVSLAEHLLDKTRPGDFNQAMMELGATVCLPKAPLCGKCPLAAYCQARAEGRQSELPVKLRQTKILRIEKQLLFIQVAGCVLLWRRPDDSRRLAGFWELPERGQVECKLGKALGSFQHSITNHHYRLTLRRARIDDPKRSGNALPAEMEWVAVESLRHLPLSTTARKALRLSPLAGYLPDPPGGSGGESEPATIRLETG